FIHFGMSTFTGREIDPGDQPSKTYAPTNLDVDQWIRVARDAGMKYAVLTAKHVPGHCLWDSEVIREGKEYNYDVATSGDTTDVVGEFMKACEKYGIAPGLYYCVLDGYNEGGLQGSAPITSDYFRLIEDHVTELLTNYPGIRELWVDIPWKMSPEQRRQLYGLVKKHEPKCLILMNNGFREGERIVAGAWPSDLINGERTMPPAPRHNPVKQFEGKTYYVLMEVCDTISQYWFYLPNDPPKSTRTLHRLYRHSVGRGANLLLNVTPDKTGRIPNEHIEALQKLKKVIADPSAFPDPVTLGKTARASHVYEDDPRYQADSALDDDEGTRWATPAGVTSAWLEVDLGKAVSFDRALILEAYPELERIRAFGIEYLHEGEWKPAYEGRRIGAELEVSFPPVTARHVRLNVVEATDGPTISVFELFATEGE
ncbi:MAG TPA: hypothetical protein DD670_07290, partial [Planctomycetaceae bacterium]|nr:hypothetical protein [Planctomycetaceae bacterium]